MTVQIDQVDTEVSLAVSTVIFALRPHPDTALPTLWLPLVRRIRDPFEGRWALPGGPLRCDEDLEASASHTLVRTTGLTPRYLEQLYAFGDVERSPGGRVVSIVYWALVQSAEDQRAIDGENVEWFVADALPPLAFDHAKIVEYALWRLRNKMAYSRIAHGFLGDEFTIAQVREVYEAVLQKPVDPANFRRQILASKAIEPTGARRTGTSHRPPLLYRYRPEYEMADHGPLTETSQR